jgi:mRNA-degrading endonuclease toxin of MazEF toxin-antitoxin module
MPPGRALRGTTGVTCKVRMHPSATNGLSKTYDVMVDKIPSLPLRRIGAEIGVAEVETIAQVVASLALFLGFRLGGFVWKRKT